MDSKDREALKGRIRRLLSVDARISMQDLADSLKTTKVNAYSLFNEVANEYLMNFVPEIAIDKLWRWEFIKRARLRTKRGILADAVEELPLTGFGEYMVFVRFIGKQPGDEEIAKAMGNTYVAQFAARTNGEYDLVIYIVDRSYEDAVRFADTLCMNLSKYDMLTHTSRIWSNFGFFPLSKKLLEQFDIFDTYKNLLFGLSNGGRNTFTEIGKIFKQGPAQMLYAYDRLARTEILRRVTYFEAKPKNNLSLIAVARIENAKTFEDSRNKWFVKLTKDYEKRENECVFMCETPDPKSMFVIASLAGRPAATKFLSGMRSSLKGAKLESMWIKKVLLGNLGIRDFDMRFTAQYKGLERKKLVPPILQKLASYESVAENPNSV